MQVYEVKYGAIIGEWEVEEKNTERINGKLRIFWWCNCSCGVRKKVMEYSLHKGKSLSCGCKRDEQAEKRSKTHGMSKTSTYGVWRAMISRCYNENSEDYENYGGRGITVNEGWNEYFELFLADMGEKPDGLTLERLDVDKPYEPGNCKWGTQEEQNNNKRNNIYITFNGESKTVAQWAKYTGLSRGVIRWRLNEGWGEDKTLTTPMVQKNKCQRKTRHGLNKIKVYRAWSSMKTRCLNENSHNFSSYGGRGIQVCQLWEYSFEEFLRDMGEPGEGMSLHRIDVHGHYCPNNCRWATKEEQANSKVNSHYITFNGESKTVSQWAVGFGLKPQIIYRRIRRGKPPFSDSEIRSHYGAV